MFAPGWSRSRDEVSGDWYWFNETTGEAKWEDDVENNEDTVGGQEPTEEEMEGIIAWLGDGLEGNQEKKKDEDEDEDAAQFYEIVTDEGDVFYVPVDADVEGGADAVWVLPAGAVVVDE